MLRPESSTVLQPGIACRSFKSFLVADGTENRIGEVHDIHEGTVEVEKQDDIIETGGFRADPWCGLGWSDWNPIIS